MTFTENTIKWLNVSYQLTETISGGNSHHSKKSKQIIFFSILDNLFSWKPDDNRSFVAIPSQDMWIGNEKAEQPLVISILIASVISTSLFMQA